MRIFVFIVLLLPILIFAQEWIARYNGTSNGDDRAYAIAVDSGGNVYVTGSAWGDNTVKYNSSGIQQWVASSDNDGRGIAVDKASNVYVTGYASSLGYYWYVTVKYDSLGVKQWKAIYDGWSPEGVEKARAIAVDEIGNVYVTGWSIGSGTSFDYVTIKYNSSGVEQWVARYNGPINGLDFVNAIAVDGSCNVYVTGYSKSDSSYDYATVKYNSFGAEQWVARYNGPGNYYNYDYARALAIDDSGNVYVTGVSYGGSTTREDYATIKYDSLGNIIWVARYNSPVNGDDEANAIAVDNSGNVYVTGESIDSSTSFDYATIKYNSSGVQQWVKRYNGSTNDRDVAYAIAVDNTGDVYVTGRSDWGIYSHYATVKYNSSGVEQWVERYNGPGNGNDMAYAIVVKGSYVYVTGESAGSGTGQDYATIKYSGAGVEEQKSQVTSNKLKLEVYPNPFVRRTVIICLGLEVSENQEIEIYDIGGRIVRILPIPNPQSPVTKLIFDAIPTKSGRQGLAPGIYFAKLKSGDCNATQKLILLK